MTLSTFSDLEEALRALQLADPSSPEYQRLCELLDASIAIESPIPKPSPRRESRLLTIGIAVYDDYDGLYFTMQAIRLYHPEILAEVEFLVLDNNPAGASAKALKALESCAPNYRYLPYHSHHGTAVRELLFREAAGDFVLCMDSHVFFPPGTLARLIDYCRCHPGSRDLLQGPLLWDDLNLSTHLQPIWFQGDFFYGYWGLDHRGLDADAAPFEIGMQGLGVFACRREAWPGFNPRLTGFGGEESYLHEKIRRAGGRALCLPFLRWTHRFERPRGVPYVNTWPDRLHNYLITYGELGLDPAPVIQQLEACAGPESAAKIVQAVQTELAGPFHFFDAIYCINLNRQTERWEKMQRRFRKLGFERKVRRFPAVATPLNHHIGCALSHRAILAEAKQQKLDSVLVFEDDARFSPDASEVLVQSLRELKDRDWQLLYLGGYRSADALRSVPGCQHLVIPDFITCTHAIAYHHSVYDAILNVVPDNPTDVGLWLLQHLGIDQYYTFHLHPACFLTAPVIAAQENLLGEESRPFDD